MSAAIFGLGPLELILIIVVVVVLFLPALLPKIARRLMDTVGTVREMTDNIQEESGAKSKEKDKAPDESEKE